MIHPSCASVASDLVHQGLEPVVRVGWLFTPVHGKPPWLAFHQLHLGDHCDVVPLMSDLEGVLYLLSVVQAIDLVIFIPA
jgi:hypothetical protein